jgi:hypothetical protein
MRLRRLIARRFAPLLFGLLGCSAGTPTPAPIVRGTVTFQGRPLAGGIIVFAPDSQRGSTVPMRQLTLDSQGAFVFGVDGIAPLIAGWYRIAIAEPPGVFTEAYGYPRFPAALRRPDRSGLSREVKSGYDQTFGFAVEVR